MNKEEIKYEYDRSGCITRCPHGVKANVGSIMCNICPFFDGVARQRKIVFCTFNEQKKKEFLQDTLINILNCNTEVKDAVVAIQNLSATDKALLFDAYFSHNTNRMSDTLLVAISEVA